MTLLAPGTCRHCGCHGESCTLADGEKCGWSNRDRIVCTAPGCQLAEAARAACARAARPLTARQRIAALMAGGWGYGAACEEIRREERRSRRARPKRRAA